jgi:RNA polymerase sigma factor (sigma-70 family)
MKSRPWKDEQIIEAICGKETERNKALKHLFSDQGWQALTIRFLTSKGADPKDAEDIFQDTFIIFDRNIRQGKFKGNSSLKTYFLSIVKRRWWQVLSKKRPQGALQTEKEKQGTDDVETLFITREQRQLFDQALSHIGERCQLILKLYQLDYSMKEIADATGISSATMAKKETYRCRIRFRRFLEVNPIWLKLIK